MSGQNDRFCYIRRGDGNGWVRSRPHHQEALLYFLNSYNVNNPSPTQVSVPHPDGGNFVARFTRVNVDNNNQNEDSKTLCYYVDEYEQQVDIMFCQPEYAAYINRIIDYQ